LFTSSFKKRGKIIRGKSLKKECILKKGKKFLKTIHEYLLLLNLKYVRDIKVKV